MYVERKKKWPIVLLVLLILGVGAFFGVRYYLELEEAKRKRQQEPKQEEVLIPLNENQQNYMFTKIAFYDGMLPYDAFTSDSLPEDKIFQFVESIKETEYVDFTRGVSADKMNDILDRYFGPKASINPNDSTCTDETATNCFYYDKKTKRYMKTTPTATSLVKTKNFYIEGTQHKETKEIILKVKQLYYLYNPEEEMVVRFFQTPEAAAQNQSPLIDLYALHNDAVYNIYDYPNYLQASFDKIKESLPVLTYTFKYQAGGYYLESVVK